MHISNVQKISIAGALLGLLALFFVPQMADSACIVIFTSVSTLALVMDFDRVLRTMSKALRQIEIVVLLPQPVFRLLANVLPVGLPTTHCTGLLLALSSAPPAAPPITS